MIKSILLTIIQTILVLGIAPLSLGLVRMFKARLQGRRGASPFLPYYSFATLLRKEMVISPVTSWVFRVVPFVVLGSTLLLAISLPLIVMHGALASLSDIIFVAGMLALGAVFLVLGGLDPGSAFGGMGASREMTIAALVEPALIMTLATFSVVSGSSNIDGILSTTGLIWAHPFLLLSIGALILVTLAENARYPVDNPATHLELTMVHEAMVLEYSGPYLAMLEYASALKLTIFTLLIGHFLLPDGFVMVGAGWIHNLTALIVSGAEIIVGMMLLALLESTIAKMRFYRIQEYMTAAFFIGLAGMIIALSTSQI